MKTSDTPRTDDQERWVLSEGGRYAVVGSHFARDLERELATVTANALALSQANAELRSRIRRLEEALDTLNLVIGLTPIAGNKQALQEALDIARAMLGPKEAKP